MLVCASLRPLRNEETIMNQIDVMKQAVMLLRDGPDNHVQEAVDLLCQAIEQAGKQEPVGTVVEDDNDFGRVKALLDQDARVQLAVGTKLFTHPPTAPAQRPPTDEQDRALCEAYCNAASDEYFAARQALDFPETRRIFYAGHRKAWIEYEAAHGITNKP